MNFKCLNSPSVFSDTYFKPNGDSVWSACIYNYGLYLYILFLLECQDLKVAKAPTNWLDVLEVIWIWLTLRCRSLNKPPARISRQRVDWLMSLQQVTARALPADFLPILMAMISITRRQAGFAGSEAARSRVSPERAAPDGPTTANNAICQVPTQPDVSPRRASSAACCLQVRYVHVASSSLHSVFLLSICFA